MAIDPTTVTKLQELLAAIGGYPDPRRASEEWKQVYRLLQKAELLSPRLTHLVGMRDLAALTQWVGELAAPAGAAAAPAGDVPDPEVCRRALRAFRKRQALTRLDDESRLSSHSPLSKGSDSHTTTPIIPPNEWPEAVWQELVRQGKLRDVAHGFYELANP